MYFTFTHLLCCQIIFWFQFWHYYFMFSESMCKFYMWDRNIVMLFQKPIMNPLFLKNSSIFYNMIIIKFYCNMNN
jgi:hypothetical protein